MSVWYRSRKVAFVAVALLLPFLPACTDSEQPLSDPDKSEPDKALIGVWRVTETNAPSYLFIGKPNRDGFPKGIMVARMVGFTNAEELTEDNTLLYLIPTTVGDDSYASVLFTDSPLPSWPKPKADGDSRFSLVKYSVKDGKLTFWTMDEEAKAAVINGKKLKGTLPPGFVKSMYFTDTADNIRAYLAKGGAKELFPDKEKSMMTYTRVK